MSSAMSANPTAWPHLSMPPTLSAPAQGQPGFLGHPPCGRGEGLTFTQEFRAQTQPALTAAAGERASSAVSQDVQPEEKEEEEEEEEEEEKEEEDEEEWGRKIGVPAVDQDGEEAGELRVPCAAFQET